VPCRLSPNHRALLAMIAASVAFAGCNRSRTPAPAAQAPGQGSANRVEAEGLLPDEYGEEDTGRRALTLPTSFGRRTGDLDQMVRKRIIRALVVISPIGFFYLQGHPQGIHYEALQEFEKFANRRLNTGPLPIRVVFLPMRPDQIGPALERGLGDVVAHGIVVTPEREQQFAFSIPVQTHVTQIVVTGPGLANVSTFDGLTGQAIYVNPVTTYDDHLRALNATRQAAGKPPLDIQDADTKLFDDDLIQMVNAGLIPATVTNRNRAELWAQVLPNLKAHPELVVASEGTMAWAMRRNNPKLKALVDEFLETHGPGTTLGNILLRRYLQDTRWIRNSLAPEELRKFVAYSELFQKYGSRYNLDYLMIAAQGYQESLLDQNKRSPAGAVGVMQVLPRVAAASPINVPDISQAEGNIHAGTKILHDIASRYFNEPGIDPVNKALFAFASYNAGPRRIAELRAKAARDGLDPNQWSGNVELEAARHIGQETVNYVGNIYKYYVAYKLTVAGRRGNASASGAIQNAPARDWWAFIPQR
jgi:membrane-bound lytic murein transglycosylase MltF